MLLRINRSVAGKTFYVYVEMKRSLPQNLPLDKPLETQFRAVAGQRLDHVVQIKDPRREFQESAFQGMMGGQRARLDSLLTGTPLSTYYPFAGGNILESFRTRNTTPLMDTAFPLSELAANATHPVNRYVKPHTDTLDGASRYELVLAYKEDGCKMDTLHTAAGYMQSAPMNIVNPAIYNHTILNQQLFDAKQDYEDYLHKTAWDYWEKWSVDGIVEFEEMLNGAESFQTSGFSNTMRTQNACGYKMITVSAKGPQFMYNYFGDNIKPGGKCYAIIKKHAMPTEFNLDNKLNVAALAGQHHNERMPLVNNVPHLVKPYQMSFVCLPNGGCLSPEATMYYDESNVLRRDGLAIYLGHIWSVPIDHSFKNVNNYYDVDPLTKRIPNVKEYTAYNDASDGIQRDGVMLMKLILDCTDGIGAL